MARPLRIKYEEAMYHVMCRGNNGRDILFGDKEVFVYGREVNDFHIVDYDAIAMLNVSATQELYRRLQTQETELTVKTTEI